jgi:uncharacterized OB-fold protein
MKVAAHPELYDPEDSVPVLHGTRCEACGSTFFPPLKIGCEICGADEQRLNAVPLPMSGVLYSVATVHVHGAKDIEVPFTVAEVQLDEGPLIRAVLAEPAEVDAIGSRVAGQWVVTRSDEDGNEVVEPRFTQVAGGPV